MADVEGFQPPTRGLRNHRLCWFTCYPGRPKTKRQRMGHVGMQLYLIEMPERVATLSAFLSVGFWAAGPTVHKPPPCLPQPGRACGRQARRVYDTVAARS